MRSSVVLLALGALCLSLVVADEPEFKSWPPTLDDRPFHLTEFGDSSNIPLQPVFNKSTVAFIKNVLEAEPQPQLPKQAPVPEKKEVVREQRSEPQPWVEFDKLREAFEKQDLDESGALEIVEAKSIFDSFHIHFETLEELNSYFGTDGMMSYVEYVNLLANKGVISQENAREGKVHYAKSIGLEEKDVQDPESFRVKQKAVVWLKKYLSDVNNVGSPFPEPPASASDMAVAKEAIVRFVVRTTGRTDAVTYENAHISKEQADKEEQKRNPTFFCHPAKMETCAIGKPCCGDLKCCPTGNGAEGYCTDQCGAEQHVVDPAASPPEGAEPTFAALIPDNLQPTH